jgi:hypothetical protein
VNFEKKAAAKKIKKYVSSTALSLYRLKMIKNGESFFILDTAFKTITK